MYGLVMTLFIILSIFLATIILIQQGKGDMGMGGLASSSQMLFGGSGGQEFIERLTWILGLLFIGGALGLSAWNAHIIRSSHLVGYKKQQQTAPVNKTFDTTQTPAQDAAPDEE